VSTYWTPSCLLERLDVRDHVAACQRQHVLARPGRAKGTELDAHRKVVGIRGPRDTSSQVLPDTLERVVDSASRYA